MRAVSATEAKQNFAGLLDSAQREPVVIRRHNRDIAVIVSPQEYERIRKARVAEYLRLAEQIGREAQANGLTPELLEQLLSNAEATTPGR